MSAAAAKKMVEEAYPVPEADPILDVDPLRAELSVAIADRAARQEDVAAAKQALARLAALIAKTEAKLSEAKVRAEFEGANHIQYLATWTPETTPLSSARRHSR